MDWAKASLGKVEQTRAERMTQSAPVVNDDAAQKLIQEYHPDYVGNERKIHVGPNADSDAFPMELADLLESDSPIPKEFQPNIDIETDVLILGGGGAGVTAALGLADSGLQVHLATKLRLGDANTVMAEGGIQAALGVDDSTRRHFADSYVGGHGKNDPQLILPLSKLGESFYFVDLSQSDAQQRSMVSTGEIYFKRAVRIAEATPDIDWREFARVKVALADHYIYNQSLNRAKNLYKEVWAFLSTDDEKLAMRKELLEQPAVLVYDSIPEYAFRDGDASTANENLLTGTIRVDYTVSSRGRVRNLRTEAIPAEFTDMQRMVHREIRRRVFRPQMVDAEIGESDSQVFEHTFYYRKSDLDKLIQANKKAAES